MRAARTPYYFCPRIACRRQRSDWGWGLGSPPGAQAGPDRRGRGDRHAWRMQPRAQPPLFFFGRRRLQAPAKGPGMPATARCRAAAGRPASAAAPRKAGDARLPLCAWLCRVSQRPCVPLAICRRQPARARRLASARSRSSPSRLIPSQAQPWSRTVISAGAARPRSRPRPGIAHCGGGGGRGPPPCPHRTA